MPGKSQQDYKFVELDLKIQSMPFQVDTNWHVITGAPSCGKTTMIDLLTAAGFQSLTETAHDYIESELASGRTLDEIFGNRFTLQSVLIGMQIEAEKGLQVDQMIFLDRALPDSLTFNRFVGMDPNALLRDCFWHRYASVFMLDPLPYHADGVRDIDEPHVVFLDEWLERDYRALGYDVVRVPVLPPRERLEFILERIPDMPA